jgi:aspartate/methionine/tyrosine aminotransferase
VKGRSRLASDIPTSGIKAMRELARSLPGVIHLEVGEPDFPTPPEVIEAAFAAARAGATRYTPTGGTEELRRAIAARVGRRHGRSYNAGQVIATSGATATIAVTLLTLAEEGDEVLVPDPGWASYAGMIFLSGAKAVTYAQQRENGFRPDAAAIRKLITPRTKVLIVNDPGNPGGAVFPRELVQDLVRLASEHDLYVISDEIYEDFTYDGEHVPAAPFDKDGRVITVSGFSKTFAMTGWRLGYAVASPEIAADITKVAGPVLSCPSSVSQAAGEAALKIDESSIAAMRESYRRRRDLVVSILEPAGLLPVRPQGAFYAMVDLSKVDEDSSAVALELLRQQQVATAPGEAFGPGGRGYVRVSFATAEAELAEGLRRIVRFAETSAKAVSGSRVAADTVASRS